MGAISMLVSQLLLSLTGVSILVTRSLCLPDRVAIVWELSALVVREGLYGGDVIWARQLCANNFAQTPSAFLLRL